MKIRNQSIAKMLPHNIEAEQAVLGCAMIDGEAPIGIVGALSDTDFYTEAHQTIFEAMSKIYENNTPIDFVTLTDQLEKTGGLEAVGGIEYI
ncbi:MAG: DnaB-like helicase N-terminal domain-containing protein, partial [Clostridia bacterium]